MTVTSPNFTRLPNDGRYINLNHVVSMTKNESMKVVVIEFMTGKSIHWKLPDWYTNLDEAIESIF